MMARKEQNGVENIGDDVRFTLRVPKILYSRVRSQVEQRQAEYSRYSATDWITEAIRQKLDGPPRTSAAPAADYDPGEEIVASLFPSQVLEMAAKANAPFGRPVNDILLDNKRAVGQTGGSAPPQSPWVAEWRRLAPKKESDQDTFWEDLARLAPGFRPDQKFWKMSVSAQVEHLDKNYPLEGK